MRITLKIFWIGFWWMMSFSFCFAHDFGKVGETFSIDEEDFLKFIQARALSFANGQQWGQMQKDTVEKTKRYLDRPTPVSLITAANQNRNFVFDPSIILDHDVLNASGQFIAKKGTRVNPLLYVSLDKTLIFYNADDPKEREFVLKKEQTLKGQTKLILVNGSILEEERRLKKIVYFDQSGKLVNRFGILHTPCTVEQQGSVLKISEVKL